MEWTQAIAVSAVIMTNLITIITLYIHLDSKTDKFLAGISEEMKDFHGRLIAQDEYFKGRMQAQDEYFKGRMEKNEAEFRLFLMNYYTEKK